ncbi:MAG TPA: hypothetical protein VHW72_00415 [Candidatus Angelobacter sp.]|nr:hypothetical protein [Candidatus Angelobacter sp.]
MVTFTLLIATLVGVCVGGAFANGDLLPKGLKLLAEYFEGQFIGLLWEHRRTRILGFSMIGEVENEPAFSDESNALTRALRLLRHVLSLNPQRLVIEWRLRHLDETPEGAMVQVVKKLYVRHCLIALVIDKDADPATASKLLKYCEVKKSVPQAIEWLSQAERPKSGKPGNDLPRWATIGAGVIGIVTFLFFVTLSVAGLFHHTLLPSDRFPAVVVLAFGTAVASVLIGGQAVVKGDLVPSSQKSRPVQFIVVGGIATLVVLLILGKILFG